MTNNFKKYAKQFFTDGKRVGVWFLIIFAVWFWTNKITTPTAQAAEAVDQQQTTKSIYSYGRMIGQSFTPAQNNITAIEVACSDGSTISTTTETLYLCAGTVNSGNQALAYNCSGPGLSYITSRTVNLDCTGLYHINKISFNQSLMLTTGGAYYFALYDPVATHTDPSQLPGFTQANANTYAGGALLAPGVTSATDMYFKTYYETTGFSSITLTINAPTFDQTYATNDIAFNGSTTNADSLEIFYGPPNASPANSLYGVNVANRHELDWDFTAQIPDGQWWIWHIAKQGTTTLTSTSTIVIGNIYGTNTAEPISSSTMSTTSAYYILTHGRIDCSATSAPSFIYDPGNFWASNSPAFLSNGSSSATNTPALYAWITGPVYALGRGPIDIGNRVSCYLSTANAGEKGQAVAITLISYVSVVSGLNNLFFGNFPMAALLLIWGVGLILWMTRKVMPFGK